MEKLLKACAVFADRLAQCKEGRYFEQSFVSPELGRVVITVSRESDSPRLARDAEKAYVRLLKLDIKEIARVANKHGWDGVENSKILGTFLDEELVKAREVLAAARLATDARWDADGAFLDEELALSELVDSENYQFAPSPLQVSVRMALEYALGAIQESTKIIKHASAYYADEDGSLARQLAENQASIDAIVAVKCKS